MPRADRFLTVRRDPYSEEVLARGGDPEAPSIPQRAGLVPIVHETYHRAPAHLAHDEENRIATERERSAVCACPHPPRTVPAPPPHVAAGLRH